MGSQQNVILGVFGKSIYQLYRFIEIKVFKKGFGVLSKAVRIVVLFSHNNGEGDSR